MTTLDATTLTPAVRFTADELAEFHAAGFVIVRGLVGPERVRLLREVTDAGLQGAIEPLEYEADVRYPGAPTSRSAAGGTTIRRLKHAQGRHPEFTELLTDPLMLNRLTQLLDGRVVMPLAHHNCVMTKHPDFGSETHWHQDIRYWSFQRPELVNVWLALGNETSENGCLQLIPGSHRRTYRRDQMDAALFLREDLPENQALIQQKVFAELQPGDVLFFHCLAFHAAGRNHTRQTKYSAVFTFRRIDNLPLPNTRSSALPELILPDVQQS